MNQPHAVPQLNQINPQMYPKPPVSDQRVPEKQGCGYCLSVFCIVFSVLSSLGCILNLVQQKEEASSISTLIFGLLLGFFHFKALNDPEYLGGKPSFLKLLPLYFASVSFAIAGYFNHEGDEIEKISGSITLLVFTLVMDYFMYGGDDDSGSFFLCFKPWVLKRVPQIAFPTYGIPPQSYPPRGYPTQQAQQVQPPK